MHLPPSFEEFTKPARCADKDCIAPATHILAIKVWAKGYPKTSTPLESLLTCKVCPNHFSYINPRDFWTDEGKRMILDAVRSIGKADPDFDSAEFAWQPMNGDNPMVPIK